MIQSGKLDKTIVLQRETETVDAFGQKTSTWAEIDTVRAGLRERTTREFMQPFGENETGVLVFKIRYLGGLTTDDRVIFDGDAFNIKEIAEIGRRRGLLLRCEATQ
ncbi:phage head closure protein [Hoeflea sp. CAU 1731]